jgi:hypothetical protein
MQNTRLKLDFITIKDIFIDGGMISILVSFESNSYIIDEACSRKPQLLSVQRALEAIKKLNIFLCFHQRM